jgi:adenylate cyclase
MTGASTKLRVNARDVDLSLGTVASKDGATGMLRPQVLAVLKLLAAHPGALVSKDEIMAAVWPGIAVTDDSLVQCITDIRKALGDDGHKVIKTVSKRGYVFEPGQLGSAAKPRGGWLGTLVGILVALIAGTGAWYGLRAPAPLATKREPSIAVLPFVNMSGDPAQDYLGPGIAEDIITMLSSYPTLRVVSRTSSFVYDKPVKVQQVATELNVNYVIEGSVKKAGGKIRVTAQLIDAVSGDHVWAKRYDEEGSNVAALQDTVASKIYDTVAGLQGQIRKKEEAEAWTKSAPGLEEYDYYLRGSQLLFRFTKADNVKARDIWRDGLTAFPTSAILRIKLAWTYILDVIYQWTDDPWRDTERAWKLAREAEAIEDKSRQEAFFSHWQMAVLYNLHEGDFSRSIIEAEATARLIPYEPFARADLASFMAGAGRTDTAIEWLKDAIRRDGNPQDWYFGNLALAYYLGGRPAEAVMQFQRMQNPRKLDWAAAYARLGKLDEARALVAQYLKDEPGWTLEREAVWPSGKQPQFIAPLLKPYLDDLRKAGLPER